MCVSSRLAEKTSVLENGCWMYIGGWNTKNYGVFWVNGKSRTAHRVAYELYVGSIPDDLSVLHTCDNPWCINPKHLFVGTQQDNIDDMISKGRDGFIRTKNGRALLDEDDIIEIKKLLDQFSQQHIANQFGVSRSTISAISTGRNWGG